MVVAAWLMRCSKVTRHTLTYALSHFTHHTSHITHHTSHTFDRLDSVRILLSNGGGGLDEMLDAEEQLSEQLESLPYLVRFQFEKSR